MHYLGTVSKMTEWFRFISRQIIQHHSHKSLCHNQKCWRSWSLTVLWRPMKTSRTNIPKRYYFHQRGLEFKSRKSRYTWSNRQVWPWVQGEAGQRLTRVLSRDLCYDLCQHTGHSKHPLPATKETTLHMDILRRSVQKSSWLFSLLLKR